MAHKVGNELERCARKDKAAAAALQRCLEGLVVLKAQPGAIAKDADERVAEIRRAEATKVALVTERIAAKEAEALELQARRDEAAAALEALPKIAVLPGGRFTAHSAAHRDGPPPPTQGEQEQGRGDGGVAQAMRVVARHMQRLGLRQEEVDRQVAWLGHNATVALFRAGQSAEAALPVPDEPATQAAAVDAVAAATEAIQAEAENAFRQRVAAFTCTADLFLEVALDMLDRSQLSSLRAQLDAEFQYLWGCGHAEVEELLDERKGWRDACETALKRKRVRCRSPGAAAQDPNAAERREEATGGPALVEVALGGSRL